METLKVKRKDVDVDVYDDYWRLAPLPLYEFIKGVHDMHDCWSQKVFKTQEENLNNLSMLRPTSTESRNISCPNIHKRSGSLQNIL